MEITVRTLGITTDDILKLDTMYENWIKDNILKPYDTYDLGYDYSRSYSVVGSISEVVYWFGFKNEEDAMAFKLRWM